MGWGRGMLMVQRCKALKLEHTPSTHIMCPHLSLSFSLAVSVQKTEHIRVVSSQMRFPFLIKENKGRVSEFLLSSLVLVPSTPFYTKNSINIALFMCRNSSDLKYLTKC